MLCRERGFLVCSPPTTSEQRPGKIALEDIRALVIAARGVTLTSNAISGILSRDGIILHCDERYAPVGITAPLPRIVDTRAFSVQASHPKRLNSAIWNRLLIGKTSNQLEVIKAHGLFSAHLERALGKRKIDEGNCARQYWKLFFPAIGWEKTRRERHIENPPNRMLNYGYTVLATLCHRSLLLHGLTPLLGVGHVSRYRTSPLVYDVMEPFRPIVDLILSEFLRGDDISESNWCRTIGIELRDRRLRHSRYSLKLMDAIDKCASSLTRCYSQSSVQPLWLPSLKQ